MEKGVEKKLLRKNALNVLVVSHWLELFIELRARLKNILLVACFGVSCRTRRQRFPLKRKCFQKCG